MEILPGIGSLSAISILRLLLVKRLGWHPRCCRPVSYRRIYQLLGTARGLSTTSRTIGSRSRGLRRSRSDDQAGVHVDAEPTKGCRSCSSPSRIHRGFVRARGRTARIVRLWKPFGGTAYSWNNPNPHPRRGRDDRYPPARPGSPPGRPEGRQGRPPRGPRPAQGDWRGRRLPGTPGSGVRALDWRPSAARWSPGNTRPPRTSPRAGYLRPSTATRPPAGYAGARPATRPRAELVTPFTSKTGGRSRESPSSSWPSATTTSADSTTPYRPSVARRATWARAQQPEPPNMPRAIGLSSEHRGLG